ncbi:MAG: 4-hydroxythreonine-4-phosphate dehydrogenase PdxA [Syntrophobacteraceae bacterium]
MSAVRPRCGSPVSQKPVVAVTMGDPCGVGPEIIVKALRHEDVLGASVPLVIGSRSALERAAHSVGTEVTIEPVSAETDAVSVLRGARPGLVQLLSIGDLHEDDLIPGKPTRASCDATIKAIETAVTMALAWRVQAVCTCPIHKANLHRHGFAFPGHTELLSQLTRAHPVVMMLAGPRLRVALATIHVPLTRVRDHLSVADLARTIEITARSLHRDFGIDSPRLAIAALNPHAGEGGRFGDEESTLITPAIDRCRERLEGTPCSIEGPFPPDTVFLRAYNREFDGVVAMYHDQGLIPLKLVHFFDGVNVTLGMPIIRTSVDHGTAYDLAGTGQADEGSLRAAILLAAQMAHNRRILETLPRP